MVCKVKGSNSAQVAAERATDAGGGMEELQEEKEGTGAALNASARWLAAAERATNDWVSDSEETRQ